MTAEKSKDKFIEHLISRRPVLTDGAWGTELMTRGLGPGECPDAWNLEFPSRVLGVGRAYVEAGVELSKRAANAPVAVFGSMGPSGKLLQVGEVTESELRDAFEEQARALAAAGADALVIETMSDLEEARLAVAAARSTGLPVVACMAFGWGKTKTQTMMGTPAEAATKTLTEAGADVIGANCGQGIENYIHLYRVLASATDRPIWLKPNAGDPVAVGGRTVYAKTPESFAEAAGGLARAGAAFIGGCCGTSPGFIREMAAIFKREPAKKTCD